MVAIDPHAGTDRGPQEIETSAVTGESDHERFLANLERAGVRERVRHVRCLLAGRAATTVDGEVDLLYVDGAHRYGPARDDIVRWGARVRPGGTMLIHDSFSSIGVTARDPAPSGVGPRLRLRRPHRSLAEYRRSAGPPGERTPAAGPAPVVPAQRARQDLDRAAAAAVARMAVLGGLRRRPLLAAALLYALLSIAFVAPALVPGKTLSASDYLWSVTPWAESTAGGRRCVRLELRPARPGLPVPAGMAVRPSPPARHPALEPAHHGRPHVHRKLPVGVCSRRSRCPPTCSGCGTRSRGWPP